MVLWEISLATAYFLGLKRTYKLALRIQRRIITPKHSNFRQFVNRRTRDVFDVAIKVHRNIQESDIKVGRNMGKFILRWPYQMKPSVLPTDRTSSSIRMSKLIAARTSNQKTLGHYRLFKRDSDSNLFNSSSRIWLKPFPTIARMTRPPSPAGTITHSRHFNIYAPYVFRPNYRENWLGGVIRNDIMQFMLQN
ncbi:uncharacterized protein LOC133296618 [Gastrolobium bilobum]|uniref:uncharacterized protein LOC133296618 n=1 Tax=Gastrolobium bilobum TaxID=150636 RepID=UPI002AB01C97|nr:uncharacterized protein LOC133296618 [Gastrolobium bilobum]